MKRRALPTLLFLAAALAAEPQEIRRTVGKLTASVDTRGAVPGGLLVVRLHRYLGTTFAILGGRRVPFYASARGPLALVPIPVTHPAGTSTLGIELWTRRGRQRIAIEVPIAPRAYPTRTVTLPEERRALLKQPGRLRDGRLLLTAIRTETAAVRGPGPFRPPVDAPPGPSFGCALTYVGGSPVESMMDAVWGEYHRGSDYDVPAGSIVQAPAAGTVVLAAPLTLTGQTLVLDHGQGVVSVFYHLSRIDVREGDSAEGGAPIALSGGTGLATSPHLHWGVYVHGIAVDPRLMEALDY